jgi:2Fe-2S ferredoxin
MWQLRPHDVGVLGLCNGNALCGTCHVYVHDAWVDRLDPPDETEEAMLAEVRPRKECSRLSCRIEFAADLAGLELTVAPRVP